MSAVAVEAAETTGITVVGISHRTAGFDLIQRLSAVAASVPAGLCGAESVALVTCNRTELWTAGGPGEEAVAEHLAASAGMTSSELFPQLYIRTGLEAVRYAMRVAAGLESLILGEAEILGQVARALEGAQEKGTAGPVLTRLFLAAVRAGRRARSETEISRHTVSVSHAAASVALDTVTDVEAPRALVVGTGEAAELAARALRHRGVCGLTVIGRTPAHARALADRLGAATRPWSELAAGIAAADIVVSGTAAREPVIGQRDIADRGGRALALVDLAIPYDVDPTVAQLPDVSRIDLGSLRTFVDSGLARRQAAVPSVEALIEDELERFRKWLEGRRVVPLITELREHVTGLIRAETCETLTRLGYDGADHAADHVARRAARKVLHEPVVRLKARAAGDGAATYVAAIRDLFALTATGEETGGR